MYGIRTNGEIGKREKEAKRKEIVNKQRMIISLREAGFSFSEIAEAFELPESSIRELGK